MKAPGFETIVPEKSIWINDPCIKIEILSKPSWRLNHMFTKLDNSSTSPFTSPSVRRASLAEKSTPHTREAMKTSKKTIVIQN